MVVLGKPLRVAIYTRKSSDEGLEQEFNSLHAQREACEAYALSQKHEGWTAIAKTYDDGGWSGGNMERPGLKALLDDIKAGLIDIVVVYKVDRLTRSLHDFARMVEVFDQHQVSFVSVTQAFNTTTSMGRLTLKVLLSFAQFEREVTGERIRDKIAASKKKGMWMGGYAPLGYDPFDRKLIINKDEAKRVRELFDLYLELDSVDAVCAEAAQRGIHSKARVRPDGSTYGAGPICRGALYAILANPIYVGEIAHRGERYPGLHEPILERTLFDKVQAKLEAHRHERRHGSRTGDPGLLASILFTPDGRRLTPTHCTRKGRRYRYYVAAGGAGAKSVRAPGHDLEKVVIDGLKAFLTNPDGLLSLAKASAIAPKLALERASLVAEALSASTGPELRRQLRTIVSKIVMADEACTLHLCAEAFGAASGTPVWDLVVPAALERRGGEICYVQTSTAAAGEPDPVLVKMLAKAQAWYDRLASGEVSSTRELAKAEGVTEAWVGQLLDVAFLAPDIKQLIVEGRQPGALTANRLKAACPLPMRWSDQRKVLGLKALG
jgi:DNA invertase Pin-like site-specific DNA recombinase